MMRFEKYWSEPIEFDRHRVYEQNERCGYGKPVGFWVSVPDEMDWPTWCRGNDYRVDWLAVRHDVVVSPIANLRIITDATELYAFHEEFATGDHRTSRFQRWAIDWAAVVERCDGIVIAPYLHECRFDRDVEWYYGWDCASGCIWNLDAIASVTAVEQQAA